MRKLSERTRGVGDRGFIDPLQMRKVRMTACNWQKSKSSVSNQCFLDTYFVFFSKKSLSSTAFFMLLRGQALQVLDNVICITD